MNQQTLYFLSLFVWTIIGIAVTGGIAVVLMFVAEYFGWDERLKAWLLKSKM